MNAVRRSFGKSPKVSLFTLGTMRSLMSQVQMYEVVKAAYKAGINHIETAPAYGPAESFLGRALKKLKGQGIEPHGGWLITSKLLPCISLEESQTQLQNILKKIGTKKIHNLAIHGLNLPEHLEWALKGDGAALIEWAKKEDLIDQIGFSSHGSIALILEALKSETFDFCSLHLHLLDPERIPIAEKALEQGVGVMAISPVDKGGRLQDPSEMLMDDCDPFHPIELAYRFLIAKGISTLTIGAFRPEDLCIADRLKNSDGPLNQQELQTLDHLRRQGQFRLGENQCHQCRQCLPCPKNVPIPDILRLRNLLIGHELETFTKERYNLIGRAGHWWEKHNASACELCGECLPRCPHNLPIPQLLKETHLKLAGKSRKRLWG